MRAILDAAGLQRIRIFASGGLDEYSLQALCAGGAPIDGFGVGTGLTTSSDVPALDCAYKLQEYAGLPRRKRYLQVPHRRSGVKIAAVRARERFRD